MRASRHATPVAILLVLISIGCGSLGCGKKGPPLAPLRLVPASVTEPSARRSADDVELAFVLPTANANGPGPIDLAHVEVFAMTVAAGAVTPPNRDLFTKERLVGTIGVRPPPVEGESDAPATPADKRPAPGDRVAFLDQLTPEKMKPVPTTAKPPAAQVEAETAVAKEPKPDATEPKPEAALAPVPALPGAKPDPPAIADQKPDASGAKPDAANPDAPTTPAAAPATTAPYVTRIYAIRGLSRSGRPGMPSARIGVPLLGPVAPPAGVTAQMPTEKAVVVDWTPPVGEPGLPPLTFNVYRRESATAPLNPSPLTEAKFEIGGVQYGTEQCFVVRTMQSIQSVTLESAPSAPACLTPLDKFPPAAPKGLRAVAEDGAVSLVWDQNAEPDLSGYLVLRGETPGDTLQPLTPEPVNDASYRDTTVKAGVRYVYVVVAVDAATPRNASGPSAREEVTAR